MNRRGRIAFSNERIGLDATVFANYPDYVPEEIKFGEIRKALAARRTPIIIRSLNTQYSTAGNRKIMIKLSNQNILDLRKGFLKMDITLTAPGSTYKRLHSNIQCIFNRIVVRSGSVVIQDNRDANRKALLMYEITQDPDMTGCIGMNGGFGTQAERNTAGGLTQSYMVPLPSNLLKSELLPTRDLANPIEIDLYLEEPSVVMETDSVGALNIAVENVEFHVEKYELESSYSQYISDYIANNGLKLGFHELERYQNLVTTSVTQNLIINSRNSSLYGIMNIFVPSATLNDPSVNDRLITWLPTGLQTTQVDVNSKLYPDEPTDCVSTNRWNAYQMYLRWANAWALDGIIFKAPPITSTAFSTDRFIQFDDFEPFPEAPKTIINPFTTLENSANIRKKYTFTVAPPANTQLDSYVEFFVEIQITAGGSVVIKQ